MTGSIEFDEAVHGLATRHPELSAATRLWGWQKAALAGLALGVGGGALLAPEMTLAVLFAVMAVPFLCVVVLWSAALWNLFAPPAPAVEPPPVRIDAELLPLYSVLVPLSREASVVPHLVAALTAIDYPAARLEIIVVIESIDTETQAALRAAALPRHMRVLMVPDGDPRTKPRAIQYALQFAHGDYVVVYDAEDMPEPDQLRRALAALMAEPGRLVPAGAPQHLQLARKLAHAAVYHRIYRAVRLHPADARAFRAPRPEARAGRQAFPRSAGADGRPDPLLARAPVVLRAARHRPLGGAAARRVALGCW
jgi:hypothetical protein